MSKFDEFMDKLGPAKKDTLQAVSNFAKEIANNGKDKLDMSLLRQDLRDAYRELGELVYIRDRSGHANEETINACEAKIDEIMAKLAEF